MRTTAIASGGLATMLVFVLMFSATSGCSNSTAEKEQATDQPATLQNHTHAQAGETCFICDPSKREAGRLWCTEHARYEDRCWICQPQLEDKTRPYCEEHGLYKDECFLCNPELKKDNDGAGTESRSFNPALDGPGAVAVPFCKEHNLPEHECGICQPQMTAELQPGEELKVRFESADAAAKAGLRTRSPEITQTAASVGAICEVKYNENEVARITPLAPGIVRRVLVDVGSEVRAGDVLVELHSAVIAAVKTAFVSAAVEAELRRLSYEREEALAAKKISSEKELQEAAAAHKTAALALSTARQQLLNYGLTEREIAHIADTHDGSAVLQIRAPYAGTLVDRAAVVGEAVEPGDALFTLADLSTMWLVLSLPADDAHLLHSGLPVEAVLAGVPGPQVRGELAWVNTSIDERSRMVRARAVVPNESRTLRAGMFGEARILLSSYGPVLSVPTEAVQHFESNPYVFVKHADDLYGLRRVVGAQATDGHFAVTAGLRPNEPVIVVGAFTAMSEFLKSRLGAGCVDD